MEKSIKSFLRAQTFPLHPGLCPPRVGLRGAEEARVQPELEVCLRVLRDQHLPRLEEWLNISGGYREYKTLDYHM